MPPAVMMGGMFAGNALMQGLANRKTGAEKGMEHNLAKQGQLSDAMGRFAQGQHSMAQPALQKALDYYHQLASGGNAGLNSVLAPQMNQMAQVYGGAQRGMERSMGRGPGKDMAIADLYKQKAGQMGMAPMMARQNAMGQLGNMGMELDQQSLSGYNSAGNMLANQNQGLGQVAGMQRQRNQGWANIGSNLMLQLYPMLMGKKSIGMTPPYSDGSASGRYDGMIGGIGG